MAKGKLNKLIRQYVQEALSTFNKRTSNEQCCCQIIKLNGDGTGTLPDGTKVPVREAGMSNQYSLACKLHGSKWATDNEQEIFTCVTSASPKILVLGSLNGPGTQIDPPVTAYPILIDLTTPEVFGLPFDLVPSTLAADAYQPAIAALTALIIEGSPDPGDNTTAYVRHSLGASISKDGTSLLLYRVSTLITIDNTGVRHDIPDDQLILPAKVDWVVISGVDLSSDGIDSEGNRVYNKMQSLKLLFGPESVSIPEIKYESVSDSGSITIDPAFISKYVSNAFTAPNGAIAGTAIGRGGPDVGATAYMGLSTDFELLGELAFNDDNTIRMTLSLVLNPKAISYLSQDERNYFSWRYEIRSIILFHNIKDLATHTVATLTERDRFEYREGNTQFTASLYNSQPVLPSVSELIRHVVLYRQAQSQVIDYSPEYFILNVRYWSGVPDFQGYEGAWKAAISKKGFAVTTEFVDAPYGERALGILGTPDYLWINSYASSSVLESYTASNGLNLPNFVSSWDSDNQRYRYIGGLTSASEGFTPAYGSTNIKGVVKASYNLKEFQPPGASESQSGDSIDIPFNNVSSSVKTTDWSGSEHFWAVLNPPGIPQFIELKAVPASNGSFFVRLANTSNSTTFVVNSEIRILSR